MATLVVSGFPSYFGKVRLHDHLGPMLKKNNIQFWVQEMEFIKGTRKKLAKIDFRNYKEAEKALYLLDHFVLLSKNSSWVLTAQFDDEETEKYNRSPSPYKYRSRDADRYNEDAHWYDDCVRLQWERSQSPLGYDTAELSTEIEILRKERTKIEEKRRTLMVEMKKQELIKEFGLSAIKELRSMDEARENRYSYKYEEYRQHRSPSSSEFPKYSRSRRSRYPSHRSRFPQCSSPRSSTLSQCSPSHRSWFPQRSPSHSSLRSQRSSPPSLTLRQHSPSHRYRFSQLSPSQRSLRSQRSSPRSSTFRQRSPSHRSSHSQRSSPRRFEVSRRSPSYRSRLPQRSPSAVLPQPSAAHTLPPNPWSAHPQWLAPPRSPFPQLLPPVWSTFPQRLAPDLSSHTQLSIPVWSTHTQHSLPYWSTLSKPSPWEKPLPQNFGHPHELPLYRSRPQPFSSPPRPTHLSPPQLRHPPRPKPNKPPTPKSSKSPRKGNNSQLPVFYLPCKIIISEMKDSINKLGSKEDNDLLKKLILSTIRKRLAIALKDQPMMAAEKIVTIYREKYPQDMDECLVEKRLKNLKACHLPKKMNTTADQEKKEEERQKIDQFIKQNSGTGREDALQKESVSEYMDIADNESETSLEEHATILELTGSLDFSGETLSLPDNNNHDQVEDATIRISEQSTESLDSSEATLALPDKNNESQTCIQQNATTVELTGSLHSSEAAVAQPDKSNNQVEDATIRISEQLTESLDSSEATLALPDKNNESQTCIQQNATTVELIGSLDFSEAAVALPDKSNNQVEDSTIRISGQSTESLDSSESALALPDKNNESQTCIQQNATTVELIRSLDFSEAAVALPDKSNDQVVDATIRISEQLTESLDSSEKVLALPDKNNDQVADATIGIIGQSTGSLDSSETALALPDKNNDQVEVATIRIIGQLTGSLDSSEAALALTGKNNEDRLEDSIEQNAKNTQVTK